MFVKETLLISFRSTAFNVLNANYLTSSFQEFCLPFRKSYFKEQLLCIYRAGPYPQHA